MSNGNARDQGHIAAQHPAAPGGKAKPAASRRLLWIMLLLLACSTVLSFVLFRYVLPSVYSVPRELVGTWQVVDGDFKGATFECRWNGTAIFTRQIEGKSAATESTIRVRGKRIFMATKDPITGKEETLIQTILKLQDDELVFRDQDQVTYHLVKIKD